MIILEPPVVLREVTVGFITYWHCPPPPLSGKFVVLLESWQPEYPGLFELMPEPYLGPSDETADRYARHIYAWRAL